LFVPQEVDREILVVCRNQENEIVRGEVTRLGRHLVSFNVYSPNGFVLLSERLQDFQIYLNQEQAYSGDATLSGLMNTGSYLVCEATLEEGWDEHFIHRNGTLSGWLDEEFGNVLGEWRKVDALLPAYKMLTADLHSYLSEIKRWLDQTELSFTEKINLRQEQEAEILEQASALMTEHFSGIMGRFRETAAQVDPTLEPTHRSFFRRLLHPLTLGAPFVWRAHVKPLGYAGDYGIVDLIMGNPYQGTTTYSKLVNWIFISDVAAEAHRNRIDWLVERIGEECGRTAELGKPCRILSIGCGPAHETQRYLESDLENGDFTLVDFNEETLSYTGGILSDLNKKQGKTVPIRLVRHSVQEIVREGKTPDGPYDLIYVAGLFDYLSHRLCERILDVCFQDLVAGGLLIATNVDVSNPSRKMMEHLAEWHLVHRTRSEFLEIAPKSPVVAQVEVTADPTGANLFLQVRKKGP